MAYIAVERNRRKQMNEHLKGDQASIIGGVLEFIKELHQLLQALESKKQRKICLSPSPSPSLSSRPFQLVAPPQPNSPLAKFNEINNNHISELGACCNSVVADVEARLLGANVSLKTISKRIPGQVVKIIRVLEKLSFEILHLSISSMEDTVLYSFVVKIGLECQLTMEELANEVQGTFCNDVVTSAI